MDENHQVQAESKPITTEGKFQLPPLSPKDKKELKRLLGKKSVAEKMGFSDKTPWDLIQLLLIPLVLAGIGYWFSAQQNASNQLVSIDQQREMTLTACMDDIKDLLLNRGLRSSKPGDEVRVVARAEVLTALRQLDGERKGMLVQFLSEANLINNLDKGVVIDLSGADLIGADLRTTDLSDAELDRAHLNGADLRGSDLSKAKLFAANLSNANLQGDDLVGTDLGRANLRGTDLYMTDLMNAALGNADLEGDDLSSTYLLGTDLSQADLVGATIRAAQLKQVKSLQGTIMPNGSVHP